VTRGVAVIQRDDHMSNNMIRKEGKIGMLFPSSANGLSKSAIGERLTLDVLRGRKVRPH